MIFSTWHYYAVTLFVSGDACCWLHLDVDGAGVCIQQLAQVLTNALLVRGQLWALQDDCCIQVAQLIAVFVHEPYLQVCINSLACERLQHRENNALDSQNALHGEQLGKNAPLP